MSATSARAAGLLERADAERVYDLALVLDAATPTWRDYGDPPVERTVVAVALTPDGDAGEAMVSDCLRLPTHCGTHVDCFSHVGTPGGTPHPLAARPGYTAELFVPLLMRAVLLDVAAALGEDPLPETLAIGPDELDAALAHGGVAIQPGDAVLLRTGWLRHWDDAARYLGPQPGLSLAGARHLVERGAALIGADNAALEQLPSTDPAQLAPVHVYLLVEAGVPIMENVVLDALARDGVTTSVLLGAPLKLTGATGAPLRPVALPLRPTDERSTPR